MNWLFIIFMVGITGMVSGNDIRSKVKEYYRSESARNFKKIWSNFQISFENTLNLALQASYGRKGLNVYINRLPDSMELAKGYYHYDNQVSVLLHRLGLVELPELHDVDVTFPLSSHMLSVDASVSKMIVQAFYFVFRNSTDLIYATADQDVYYSSPFRFQQVAPLGNIAITLEGCSLQGYAVATLSGNSVNLGHPSFKLKECQITNEINDNVAKGPPVIAHYLFNGIGINLDSLMLRPLLAELMPKLQAAMFSYVNTSTILGENLPKIRAKQQKLLQETNKYEDALGRCMIKLTLESQDMGTIKMPDFDLTAQDTIKDSRVNLFALSDVMLVGLDTLYSSHTGGPVDGDPTRYAQQIRFKTLQVTGTIGKHSNDKFAVEITDFAVNVEVDKSYKLSYDVLGWRIFEFSSFSEDGNVAEAFVVGYLQNELPKLIIAHLEAVHRPCENALHNKK